MSSEKLSLTTPSHTLKWRFSWRKAVVYILTIITLHRLCLILFTHRARTHYVETLETSKLGYGPLYQSSWHSLAEALTEARPKIRTIGHFVPVEGISVQQIDEPTSINALQVKGSDIQALKNSHSAFVKRIRDHSLSVIYQPTRAGIVVTAGFEDLPAILVQLRLLRRTQSKMPVQVFVLNQDDYDDRICKHHFASLNAECKILDEFLDSTTMPRLPKSLRQRRIQANEPLHKLLAVFFSKFEDVMLLDPATLVYNNPDMITKEEPYLSTGLLMWPDFWASTVSPKIFAIQDAPAVKHNSRDKLRTVDMGQFVISKASHSATLLLSIYYTYYGENLYNSLLMQSMAGEKGAQSLKGAAQYLEAPYYMVKRYVEAVGFPDMDRPDQGFHGVAMQQPNPTDDYHKLPNNRQRPLFIRANNPKLHAAHLMDKGVTTFRPQKEASSSTSHRMWEWFDARHASNGWRDPDPERAVFEEIWTIACKDHKDFSSWPQDEGEAARTCEKLTKHREALGWKDFFVL